MSSTSSTGRPRRPTPDRRRRHLMDPDAPRPVYDPQAEIRLRNVQRWVLSSLAVLTILHLSGGVIATAMFLSRPTLAAQIQLNLIAGAFAAAAAGAWLGIHGRSLLSWWLPAAFVTAAAIGLFLTLR